MNKDTILHVNINEIVPNANQPRKFFDEKSLTDLATSIKEYGILNPILVIQKDDKYEIIAGERRYRAAKLAGLNEVPIIIKKLQENKLTELALIENLHRENLNPIEEAKSYQDIIKSSNITQQELGNRIGKSQAFIANKIRLLSLPKEIQIAVAQKKISERHARSLMQLNNEETQKMLLDKVIKEKITVKELDTIIEKENQTNNSLNTAIDDIMKSLNKKEEKESDNMNNGNFFPNFNNQTGGQENVSLNAMNMQAMGPAPIQQETVMPSTPIGGTPLEMPQMTPPTIEEPTTPPMMDTPLFNQTPTQDLSVPNGIPEFGPPTVPTQQETVMPSAPIGGTPLEMPQMTPPIIEEPTTPPMMDTPLFNQTPTQDLSVPNGIPEFNQPMGEVPSIETNTINSGFEVPVDTPSMPSLNTNEDNATKVKNFLNQNGINYKAYSNETNQCIIIEL